MRLHEAPERLGRQRPAEPVALHLVAPAGSQVGHLLGGFDAFRDGFHAQALGQADDGAHDGLVFPVLDDIAHERLVDLELVDLEPLEVTQR